MKPVVEKLTVEDMVNILAYVSSRKPYIERRRNPMKIGLVQHHV